MNLAALVLLLLAPTSPHVTPPAPTVTAAHVSAPAVRWTPGMPKTFRPAPPRPPRPPRPRGSWWTVAPGHGG